MKKLMLIAAIVLGAINAGAQTTKVSADTTIVKSVVRFDKETFEGSKGTHKETYQVLVDGKWYSTTKTAYDRYFTIKRFGGQPCVAYVKKGKNVRIIVL
jgi:hypothetical protein